jgi:spermidine synthase
MVDVIDVETVDGPLDVVSIGGGGFTLPGYLDAVRPGTTHVVLEIDESLIEIGRRDLGFGDEAVVRVGDARRSIETVPSESADLVVGDAFSGLTVPWHLTTVEFVETVSSKLAPDGIYTLNVIDTGDLSFARAEAATLLEAFEHVAVLAPPDYLIGAGGGNFVLVGSDQPIDLGSIEESVRGRGGVEVGVAGVALTRFIGDARPLFDDFAPVDQLIAGL